MNRFQNIGLSLRVWPCEYRYAFVRLDERLLVIPEVFKAQRFDMHNQLLNTRTGSTRYR